MQLWPMSLPQNKNNSPVSEYFWSTTEDVAKSANLKDFSCNIRSLEK